MKQKLLQLLNESSTTTNQYIYGSLYALNASGNQVNKKFNHTCSRIGYTGSNWVAPNGRNEWNFNSSVIDDWINNVYDNAYGNTNHNITLTPKWSANKFTVAYNANGGSGYTSSGGTVYAGNTSSCTQTQTCACDKMWNYSFDSTINCGTPFSTQTWSWYVEYTCAQAAYQLCNGRGGFVSCGGNCTITVSTDCGKTYH